MTGAHQAEHRMSQAAYSRIFISYSHRNEQWKERLLKQLAVFEQHHSLEVWHDENMEGGADWERRIHEAMDSARFAIVLLCPDALSSTFMVDRELPVLERRWRANELSVIPILYKKDCLWEKHAWLTSLQTKPRLAAGAAPLSEIGDRAEHHLRTLVVKFEQGDRKEQGGTTFKMLAAFENWFARSDEFGARQLAVLRSKFALHIQNALELKPP